VDPVALASDKVMFEIYREGTYSGRYRVVYFTELQDYNKESEINRAMAGEHFYDGFIRNYRKEQAKEIISRILERLNSGEKLTAADVERELQPFVAS
jgi:thiaminase